MQISFAEMNQNWYAEDMKQPTLDVRFFKTETGNEPVREWLRGLPAADKKTPKAELNLAKERLKQLIPFPDRNALCSPTNRSP